MSSSLSARLCGRYSTEFDKFQAVADTERPRIMPMPFFKAIAMHMPPALATGWPLQIRNWLPAMGTLMFLAAVSQTASSKEIAGKPVPANRLPNIVFILADDLGYGDLGCFGQDKIRTPHIDQLAQSGMRLTQHYSGSPVCAPSRGVLMTGLHTGHAVVRDNRQFQKESQYPLPPDCVTLPRILQHKGYATGAFGKWGLGGEGTTGVPGKQGIDRFSGYLCQAVAHNYYPTSIWENDRRRPLGNAPFAAHQKFPPQADAADAQSYARYAGQDFAPDLIAEQALQFVRENKDRPFFLYFPSTIPHLALQVPGEALAEYQGKFPEEPYLGDRGYLPHATPRAAYAAMVSRLDSHVGQLVKQITELGLDEHTLYVFTSDNGPLYDRLGGTDADFFQSARDLRGRKGSLYEGGIRVPTVVKWTGKIAAGTTSPRVTGFEDWLPTLLSLANLKGEIPANLDGIDFAPTLLGGEQPAREFLYREFPAYGGQQMVRLGDWKGVRQRLLPRAKMAQPHADWELYLLTVDAREQTDVANEHPEKVAEIARLAAAQHTPSAAFPFPALDEGK